MSLLISIIALGFIIFFHELGHFLLAKRMGVGVVEFALGMGPRLISRVYGKTRYSLRALPFGGSCMMVGEESEENGHFEEEDREDADAALSKREQTALSRGEGYLLDGRFYRTEESFLSKAAWKRFLIIAAGPVFNFILALFLSIIITQQVGYDRPVVLSAEAGMPAAESGISAGDTILSINGEKVTVYRDIQLFLLANQREMQNGMPVTLRYRTSGGEERTAAIQPVFADDTQSYRMGLTFNGAYSPAESWQEVLRYGAYNVEFCIKSTVKSLEMLVSGKVHRDDLMGPVRMVATMDSTVETASQYGLWTTVMSLFDLIILISASLGAMNLLPFPALDGGQLVFIVIEMISGRPVPRELVARINMAGMLLLLMLMVFVLFNDITFILK
ncbi:MAG: M50 family metallopeptidase [Eubacteriales bacterium]|nr:M50 family metallopeptidase [Eubacteriales bacterium]